MASRAQPDSARSTAIAVLAAASPRFVSASDLVMACVEKGHTAGSAYVAISGLTSKGWLKRQFAYALAEGKALPPEDTIDVPTAAPYEAPAFGAGPLVASLGTVCGPVSPDAVAAPDASPAFDSEPSALPTDSRAAAAASGTSLAAAPP